METLNECRKKGKYSTGPSKGRGIYVNITKKNLEGKNLSEKDATYRETLFKDEVKLLYSVNFLYISM